MLNVSKKSLRLSVRDIILDKLSVILGTVLDECLGKFATFAYPVLVLVPVLLSVLLLVSVLLLLLVLLLVQLALVLLLVPLLVLLFVLLLVLPVALLVYRYLYWHLYGYLCCCSRNRAATSSPGEPKLGCDLNPLRRL